MVPIGQYKPVVPMSSTRKENLCTLRNLGSVCFVFPESPLWAASYSTLFCRLCIYCVFLRLSEPMFIVCVWVPMFALEGEGGRNDDI